MTFVLALSVGLLTKNVEILRFLVDVEVLSALDVRVDDGDELWRRHAGQDSRRKGVEEQAREVEERRM
jgi:hypothetical protein